VDIHAECIFRSALVILKYFYIYSNIFHNNTSVIKQSTFTVTELNHGDAQRALFVSFPSFSWQKINQVSRALWKKIRFRTHLVSITPHSRFVPFAELGPSSPPYRPSSVYAKHARGNRCVFLIRIVLGKVSQKSLPLLRFSIKLICAVIFGGKKGILEFFSKVTFIYSLSCWLRITYNWGNARFTGFTRTHDLFFGPPWNYHSGGWGSLIQLCKLILYFIFHFTRFQIRYIVVHFLKYRFV